MRINIVAPNAMEGRIASLNLETGVIATIIENPKTEETRRHQEGIDQGSCRQIEHVEKLGWNWRKAMQASGPASHGASSTKKAHR